MNKLVAVGALTYVLLNMATSLIYAFATPILDRFDLISWQILDAKFWLEVALHGFIVAIFGILFCRWFARRVAILIKNESVFE